ISCRYREKSKKSNIVQKDNKIDGDMAGGNIIKTDSIKSIDTDGKERIVEQRGNIVGGDMAGGNIIKNED
ncbi:MAG: hypothetical protein AB1499_17265, partial [Nitrospirota bacterium]